MTKKRTFNDWEQYYKDERAEDMPWYYEQLDHDLDRAIKELGITGGRALDLGTGPGTQAIALCKLGFTVVATDLSSAAIKGAKALTEKNNLNIDFRQDNIIQTKLAGTFDFVFDRGCFHVMQPEDRVTYLNNISRLIKKGGYLFLKTFCYKEKMEGGPYRFRPEEIKKIFSSEFEIISIEESEFHGTLEVFPKALFAVLRKK